MTTIPDLLKRAVSHHQAGQLSAAERSYQEVLQLQPDQPDALHLLGVIASQVGKNEIAAGLIRRALAARPSLAEAWSNLGNVLRALGKPAEAEASYRRALGLKPASADAHNGLGNALKEQGKLDEAVAEYRTALHYQPDLATGHHNLGLALAAQGKPDEALLSCHEALRHRPDFAEAHNALGNAYASLGQLADAVSSYRQAVQRKPDYAEAYSNLGNTLRLRGDLDEAAECCRRALQIKPDLADAHNNLGTVLQLQGDAVGAEQHYRRALATNPEGADVHHNLGEALKTQNRFEDAQSCFERATELNPDYAEAHNALGQVLRSQGKIDESIPCHERALALKPDCADFHAELGNALKTQGKLDEAVQRFRRALELDPTQAEAHSALAHAGREANDGRDPIAELENLLATGDKDDSERSRLHFALAKRYSDSQDWDRAFSHYQEGNRLVDVQFDAERSAADMDAIIQHCPKSLLKRGRTLGDPSELPVLIVGLPRSGTSLVEQVLASHPAVFGAGELPNVGRLCCESLPMRLNGDRYPWALPQINETVAREMAGEYLSHLRSLSPEALRVIDKMPGNLNYLGLVALLLPKARIIHCRRDPYDVCLSCYFTSFSNRDGLSFAFDLRSLGLYHRQYAKLTAHWREALPLRMFEVDYENLVADQESVSRQLVEFCGLEWDPACLEFHRTDRNVRTASSWQVRQPMYTTSVGRWKHYEKHLGPLREALGDGS